MVQLFCQWFLVFWLLFSFLGVGSDGNEEEEGNEEEKGPSRTLGVLLHLAVLVIGTLLLSGAGAFSLLLGSR